MNRRQIIEAELTAWARTAMVDDAYLAGEFPKLARRIDIRLQEAELGDQGFWAWNNLREWDATNDSVLHHRLDVRQAVYREDRDSVTEPE